MGCYCDGSFARLGRWVQITQAGWDQDQLRRFGGIAQAAGRGFLIVELGLNGVAVSSLVMVCGLWHAPCPMVAVTPARGRKKPKSCGRHGA